ncbi:SigE family RNA polymerase sigma factor [Nocardioides deserti]|uniref:SigE family RNA polymerase sigma factor n=1 Tax=Nocardioides deserti TaxID=1588644 RepID=A0ABR6U9G5_9ACTN|nr:SigE family RNA polymerase sigma factor [Nocardioides deserti]MBC2961018.1 SigE family RNA polymerase sigma factor [Nocardioides deserti]GGO76123.1 RNA polymerase sigma factor [Nocardioides deserti]
MERSTVDEPAAARREQRAVTFEGFVAARGDALWRAAWLLNGDHQLAEDLVQTALGKSWRAWDRVGPEAFEAYVRRAMFTTHASWWRRKWRGERPTADLPEGPTPGADSSARLDLVIALAALPRGQRAVVVLRYFEDLTERETADVLGISVGTVKSQASRALRILCSSPHVAREEHAGG